jgi:hypothetical protein
VGLEQGRADDQALSPDLLQRGWEMIARNDVNIGAFLPRLDGPVLFAQHEGYLASTDEGLVDAAATSPRRALCQGRMRR